MRNRWPQIEGSSPDWPRSMHHSRGYIRQTMLMVVKPTFIIPVPYFQHRFVVSNVFKAKRAAGVFSVEKNLTSGCFFQTCGFVMCSIVVLSEIVDSLFGTPYHSSTNTPPNSVDRKRNYTALRGRLAKKKRSIL